MSAGFKLWARGSKCEHGAYNLLKASTSGSVMFMVNWLRYNYLAWVAIWIDIYEWKEYRQQAIFHLSHVDGKPSEGVQSGLLTIYPGPLWGWTYGSLWVPRLLPSMTSLYQIIYDECNEYECQSGGELELKMGIWNNHGNLVITCPYSHCSLVHYSHPVDWWWFFSGCASSHKVLEGLESQWLTLA